MLFDSSGASANPYRYRGEQYDSDLDAYYLRARYYQPGTGRFLTTDPVEGMIGDSLSTHRYLYGYDNPVNNIDPSGEMNVQEVMLTAGLISATSSFGVATLSMAYENVGDSVAYVLPDAGIIGASLFGTVRALWVLSWLLDFCPIPGFALADIEGGYGVGVDMLFSISSGQYGFYVFHGWQAGMSLAPKIQSPLAGSATIHHGWVWNLWNTDNYTGPFASVNVGLGPYGGVSLFKDANRFTFDHGPFGMSFSALNVTWPKSNAFSLSIGKAQYPERIGGVQTYHYTNEESGMLGVALNFMAAETAMFGLAALTENAVGLITSMASVSWPTTIAMTKGIWNERRGWDVDVRRIKGRPNDFSSGPKRWIFFGG